MGCSSKKHLVTSVEPFDEVDNKARPDFKQKIEGMTKLQDELYMLKQVFQEITQNAGRYPRALVEGDDGAVTLYGYGCDIRDAMALFGCGYHNDPERERDRGRGHSCGGYYQSGGRVDNNQRGDFIRNGRGNTQNQRLCWVCASSDHVAMERPDVYQSKNKQGLAGGVNIDACSDAGSLHANVDLIDQQTCFVHQLILCN
ncbi:hypothetical protein BCR37DRAFT_391705 [Protomyces lactucae-debilis]|uniref:Uncharacterized protein n=1 Tax=Protomyces lactucae-debilis TaxID=2754530 RepID=A0A1Y2FM03_PROLT|nr:uncharacterized protein BCR37DRAFT_391705 [Protomyces lactucae-debilis]ORY85000.1 hypothetical protein BCR37DRAFT_391705 [Protomyces lactucae-debilis]